MLFLSAASVHLLNHFFCLCENKYRYKSLFTKSHNHLWQMSSVYMYVCIYVYVWVCVRGNEGENEYKANMCMIGQRRGKTQRLKQTTGNTHTHKIEIHSLNAVCLFNLTSSRQTKSLISSHLIALSLSLKYPVMSSKEADVRWQLFL